MNKVEELIAGGAGTCGLISTEEIKRRQMHHMMLEKPADVCSYWLLQVMREEECHAILASQCAGEASIQK